jgi:hypothetical protein
MNEKPNGASRDGIPTDNRDGGGHEVVALKFGRGVYARVAEPR